MTRQLDVYIDSTAVGTLFENTGIWSFQYDTAWMRNGFALSPGLAMTSALLIDTGTRRPVQWFFDNLLPEADARHQLIASMAPGKSMGADAWTLLEYFGAESAGALTLLPPGGTLPPAGLLALSDADLEARIEAMPRQALLAKAPKKMSLAGAQQKLPVVMLDGQLFEPTGASASTHILKPNVLSEHFPCSAINEWFSMRLAKLMGLAVPTVALRFVPSPVYIIERFDRRASGGGIERLHALDAMQLLTLDASTKYAESGIKALNAIQARCTVPATARVTLLRWTIFNILIGNSDAHLKNISLLAGPGGYMLAPHYDLVSTAAWDRPDLTSPGEPVWPNIAMSFPIAATTHFSDLRKMHLLEFAEQLGVGLTGFNREFNRMIGGIEAAAATLYAEFEARTDVPPALRPAQMHMLRCIQHLPISTMVRQLQ